jgi:deoxyribonuclease IV
MNAIKPLVGVYVSLKSPDYLLGSINTALKYGSNSFMIFTSSPQRSVRIDINQLKIEEFKLCLNENNIDISNVVVHGSYLINLANIKNKEKLSWSIKFFKEEISRMEAIGLKTLIIHPGSSLGEDKQVCLLNIAKSLNEIIDVNSNVRVALETMSGKTNEIGSTFDEIKIIIDNVNVNLREKVGVCWDTCHLYSAGYDIKNKLVNVIDEFKNKIGLEKLWVIHLNDSLYDFGSRKDRHQYIGKGCIGFKCLKQVVHYKDFQNVIKILEMPLKEEFDEINNLMKK